MKKDFDTITQEGAIDYLSSFIEDMEDKIKDNHPKSMLYEERVLFLKKALEMIRKVTDVEKFSEDILKPTRSKVKLQNGKVKNFTIEINGKFFRCKCGANVFTKYDDLIDGWQTYICNGCRSEIDMK